MFNTWGSYGKGKRPCLDRRSLAGISVIFKKNTIDHGNLRYQGKPMVNSPLIRPAIYWGKRGIGGGTLDSHDIV